MSPQSSEHVGFASFFFSREESCIHVHAQRTNGEAKFWIEPQIELAVDYELSQQQLNNARKLIEQHESKIRKAWQKHFGS